jgi:hypothetical protein
LNLSGNPRLDLGHTLEQLKESVVLEQVAFGVMEEAHKLYYNSRKYRDRVLVGLLPQNPLLKWVDNVYDMLGAY